MGHARNQIAIFMPNVAATNDEERYFPVTLSGSKAKIVKVRLVADETVTAHASNYATLALKKGGTTLASWSTATGGDGTLTEGTDVELTISGTGEDIELSDGDVLEFDKVESGTGVAFQGTLVVEIEEQPIP
jgi:hypothetical protein